MPQLEHSCGVKPYKIAEPPHINAITVPPKNLAKLIRDCSFWASQSPRHAEIHGKLVSFISLLQNSLFS